MVAQVAITGSGSAGVSPAQSSASSGSSFTELLQSMVQPSSAHGSSAASSLSDCAASKPVQTGHSDTSTNRSVNQQPKMSETNADKDQVAEPATADTRAREASREPSSAPVVKSDSADDTDDSAADGSRAEHKDDADALAGLTLLSAIPPTVQPAVVPVTPETPETGNEDVASAAPSVGEQPEVTVTSTITQTAATNAGAIAAKQTSASVKAAPADVTAPEPAAVNGADKELSDEPNAAAANATSGKATSTDENQKDVPSTEPVDKSVASAAQAAIQEKLAHAAVPHVETAKETAAALVANTDTVAVAQAQAGSSSANPAVASADSKPVAQQPGPKAQATDTAQPTVEHSKERTSSRQAEPESGTKQGSKDATQFSSISVDANAVAAMHGSRNSESAPQQQDVPLQQATPAASHALKANDSRSAELGVSGSLQASAAAANATHTPDTSWMSSVRLMERISQSEMRVGIQSELGDIAVRTAMNRHELSAEISVQHAGLRDAIVAEIPALQSRLSTQQIPMTNVSVTADAGGGGNSFQQSAQDGRPANHYSAAANNNDGSVMEHEPVAPVEVLGRRAGLDIRI